MTNVVLFAAGLMGAKIVVLRKNSMMRRGMRMPTDFVETVVMHFRVTG